MIVFIGMETSGQFRRLFQSMGIETYSCDLLPSEDGGEEMAYSADGLPLGRHLVGDVDLTLDNMAANDLWPTLAIFHPDCTHLTGAAAWAFKDPDFVRYPGVGYHQKVKPGTLTGKARRDARDAQLNNVRRWMHLPIELKAFENPVGAIGSHIMPASQIVQPNQCGDDASKATCFWYLSKQNTEARELCFPIDPALQVAGRMVEWPRGSGIMRERWANQLDSGQNALSPAGDRWKDRSRTYPGIAQCAARHWALRAALSLI